MSDRNISIIIDTSISLMINYETGIVMTDDSMALWLSVAHSKIEDADCIENA